MGLTAVGAVALAAVLDRLVGEPPDRFHPVAWFGRAVVPVDRTWSRPTLAGGVAVLVLPGVAALAVAGVVAGAALLHPVLGGVVAGLVLFVTSSHRMLVRTALEVVDDSEGDLERARNRLPALVGRDPEQLDAPQVRSAAVESAAENLADGLVAPLLAFAVLAPVSVPAAAGAAAWVKAVNTLDSMLGYRSKPVGRLPARVDDYVMWIPARASAALIAVAARSPGAVGGAREWTTVPDSPNSGWPMGTVAVAIDARLEKPGAYVLHGGNGLPSVERARRGVQVVAVAGLLAYLLAAVPGTVDWFLASAGVPTPASVLEWTAFPAGAAVPGRTAIGPATACLEAATETVEVFPWS